MNDKEVSELRRRFQPAKSNITRIRGCYVSDQNEIMSEFDTSVGLMEEEDKELVLNTLKKALSGTLGKNLLDISFPTQEVLSGECHKLLSTLRDSKLDDDEAIHVFFEKAVAALTMDGNYLLMLTHDVYDVPYRGKDGARFNDGSSEVFSYLLCAICPVKSTKTGLSYDTAEKALTHLKLNLSVAAPTMGFLFPAFDDRSTNLYNALLYTKSTLDSHDAFIEAVFNAQAPMPADLQRESFQSILHDTLAESCSLDVVQAVHEQLNEMIVEHKAAKVAEPLVINKNVVKGMLETSGVEAERVAAFDREFNAEFGADAELSPANLVDKQFAVKTPDVTIRVNPERTELVETRILGGAKYILIRAEEGVEVNGVDIHIPEA
jgi:hypothetical protein